VKLLVRFSKRGPLRFLSNLDTIELFKRALRRADLPVAFSNGNHPQPRVAILHPLPVGVESDAEFLQLELSKLLPRGEFESRLSPALPEGIDIEWARPVARKLTFPRFDFAFRVDMESSDLPTEARVAEVLASDSLPVVRRRKGRERTEDVRPYVRAIERHDDHLFLKIAVVDGKTARPDEILEVLGISPLEAGAGRPPRVRKLDMTYGDR